MGSAVALSNIPDTKWTVKSGPMAGVVRLVQSVSFTVGRNPECELAITDDPKVSRKHATVSWAGTGYEIVGVSDANRIWVNGREIKRAILNNNDVIKLGESEIQFNMMMAPQMAPQIVPNMHPGMAPPPNSPFPYPMPARGMAVSSRGENQRRPKPQGSTGNGKRLLIYGAIGLLLWLVLAPDAKKKKEKALRTEQEIQADIETATKLRDAAQTQAQLTGGQISQRQAQENYVKGFRDYRKGQYERALEAFQACLALQPDHSLCTRYYRISQRKFDELIQYQMVLGKKYRDQNQFKSCRSSFRNVMVMVKDAQSAAYKEAKANYEACNALVEGRF